jgi:hypothetical protein
MTGENTITFTRREKPTVAGDWVFRRDGVKASVYINKRIFVRGEAPASITITADVDVFRLPGNLDPEATALRIAQLEDRESKKRNRAESDLRAADDLRKKAELLSASLDSLGQ